MTDLERILMYESIKTASIDKYAINPAQVRAAFKAFEEMFGRTARGGTAATWDDFLRWLGSKGSTAGTRYHAPVGGGTVYTSVPEALQRAGIEAGDRPWDVLRALRETATKEQQAAWAAERARLRNVRNTMAGRVPRGAAEAPAQTFSNARQGTQEYWQGLAAQQAAAKKSTEAFYRAIKHIEGVADTDPARAGRVFSNLLNAKGLTSTHKRFLAQVMKDNPILNSAVIDFRKNLGSTGGAIGKKFGPIRKVYNALPKWMIGGAGVGAGVVGTNLFSTQPRIDQAYREGFGQATGQLTPVISALGAPQGAWSLPPYARQFRA
jgi:hypothetical protein